MKRVLIGVVLVASVAAFGAWGMADDGAATADDPKSALSGRTVDELISDLGADSAETREAATDELVARGDLAVPALEKAKESDDPEISWRARSALREIRGRGEKTSGRQRALGTGPRSAGSSISIRIGGPGALSMSQDPDGRVTVTVSEDENGVSTTKTYTADSMEEFREKYPEVARKYGIGEGGFGGLKIDFGHGSGGGFTIDEEDPFAGIDERLKGNMEGFRKQMDEQMRELDRIMKELREGRPPDFPGRRRVLPPSEEGEEPRSAEATPPASPTPLFGATLSVLEPALRYQLDLPGDEGILVDEVRPGSIAEKAGLQQYDVILKVDQDPVVSALGFRRQWKKASLNPVTEITVLRGGERQVLRVTGAEREK